MKIAFALASLLLASGPGIIAAQDFTGTPLAECPQQGLTTAYANLMSNSSPTTVSCELVDPFQMVETFMVKTVQVIDLKELGLTGVEIKLADGGNTTSTCSITNIIVPGLPPLNAICSDDIVTVYIPQSLRNLKSSKGFCIPCFSGHSTVDVEGKGVILMKDLQVGDKVQTTSGEYQTIYSFMHYHETKPVEYLQVYTDSPSKGPLEISGDHMVFLADKKNPVPAKMVKVGDKLSGASGSVTVSKINTVTRKGLYAPVTQDGTLIINGVLASSYITFQDTGSVDIRGYKVISFQFLEHLWEMPHRILCLGFGGSDYCKNEFHDENGYNTWSHLGIRLIKFAEQQSDLIQVIMLIVYLSIFLPMHAMEMVVMMPGAFVAVLATFGAWHYYVKNFATTVKSVKTVE